MTRLLATVSGYARIDSPPPMTYRTCQPSPPLDQFVDWYWFYSDLQAAHSVERVLPDGTFEFIIDLSDVPRKLFDRDNPGKYREFRGAWLSGARAEPILIDVVQKTSMIGVHFKPGGASAFMRMPAGELTSRVEDSESIWGGAARDLRARLLEEESISGRFRLLEAFLRGQLVATTQECGYLQRD